MTSRKLITGVNDLATTMPELAAEWNYEKNGTVSPEKVMAGSQRKVWWKCSNGHEYQAAILHRKHGHGCPYCSGLKTLPGINDLATLMPELANEWNYEKNGTLKPCDVKPGSSKNVWWKCSLGHEWKMLVRSRTAGCGCPYCSNRQLLPGFNDLATKMPHIATEWNQSKNGALKPEHIGPWSRRKVWWTCNHGHNYYTSVLLRKEGYGCPYCSSHKLLPGFNDLATKAPDVVFDWNYERNGNMTPEMVMPMSIRKVWWKCCRGHEYEMTIHSRVEGKGCPYCSGNKVLPGYNDLATRLPGVAESWDYERNGNLTPQMVTAKSSRRVWWRCKNGHEWLAKIDSREEHGCPYCVGLVPTRRHLVP